MRIIHGKYKYRKIAFTNYLNFNPIATAIRESIFNVLKNYLDWEKTQICDLFAGSGILGLEALSWGGKFCFFNDINPKNCELLRKNLEKFKINSENAQVSITSYTQFIAQLNNNKKLLDLVFIDPPYQKKEFIQIAIEKLIKSKTLNKNAILVIRTQDTNLFNDKQEQTRLVHLKTKKYNKHYVHFWQFQKNKPEKKLLLKNKLIILSGPSGVGKKTIITSLLKKKPLNLAYSVSLTTRQPRKNEKDGKDYYFVNEAEFKEEIKKNNFIEYAQYIDKYYGTSQTYVERLTNQDKNVLLEIEIIGAIQVKQKYPKAIWIFLSPPSFDELEKRIIKRGTENEKEIHDRISKAKKEMNSVTQDNLCDYYVINDTIETTINEIETILEKELNI